MKHVLVIGVISALALLGVAFAAQQNRATYNPINPTPVSLDSDKLWSVIQNWRTSEGLQPYIKDQRLCQIAQARVKDLKGKTGKDFNHDNFMNVLESSNIPNGVYVSENITGASTEDDALHFWLKSPSHSKALHDQFKYSCTAVGDRFAVQIFSNL